MSAVEELAQRELTRQDVKRDMEFRALQARGERRKAFRKQHPWLYKLWYGRSFD